MLALDFLYVVVLTACLAVGGYFVVTAGHDGAILHTVDKGSAVPVKAVGLPCSPFSDVRSWTLSIPVQGITFSGTVNAAISQYDRFQIEQGRRHLIVYPTGLADPPFVSKFWLPSRDVPVFTVAGLAFTDAVFVGIGYVGIGILFCVGRWWWFLRKQPRWPIPEPDIAPWLVVDPKLVGHLARNQA